MSTLAEVLAEILLIVPQADNEALIRNKINASVNFISKSGWFYRDHVEAILGSADGVSSTALTQSIPITTAQRRFSYIASTNTNESPITFLEPKTVVKADCAGLVPIAYVSGSNLIMKHVYLTDEFKVGYYTSPAAFATDGSEDSTTNWILEMVPELVVDFTAAYVLNTLGDSEDSKRISDFAGLLRGTYIRDFVNSHI